ncbi:hypothetical protein QBZ16_000624 [Prototheca wickerhamii]|uniref:Adenosylmethionine decarboxylase n=1 Tax=Prototheca wickerhamii TaxID=3111 RepID=A0AAD9ING6_PROWI|nr:hypothetical protein QBZ16_000624 [Prototheca wickerhamii]
MCPSPQTVLPCPVFEGSEKRISVSFVSRDGGELGAGLRALTRAELDRLMEAAACLIVSARHHASHDAYVLSESSCFVYPDRIVMKTCGTTRLLGCVPLMLQMAAGLGLEPAAVKYSRASFLFPESQPEEHASFEAETALLRAAFASLPLASAYVLGDALSEGLQWHYAARAPLHTLEVCMTGLGAAQAARFFRDERFVSSRAVTVATGIQGLLPAAQIDDYVFEPCGYSMNAVDGEAFATIHVTPEDGFSYASFELCGEAGEAVDVPALVARVCDVFAPAHVAVAVSVDGAPEAAHLELAGSTWAARRSLPGGYQCHAGSFQELRAGGHVAFFSLVAAAPKGKEEDGVALPEALEKKCVPVEDADEAPAVPEPAAPKPVATARSTAPSSEEGGSPRAVLSSAAAGLLDCSVCTDLDSLGGGAAEDLLLSGLVLEGGPAPGTVEGRHAAALIRRNALEDTFYVIDLGAVARLAARWRAALPRVRPHYAVKALPDAGVLATLAALGAGFDCASEAEARAVRALGVPAERILLANACKRPGDLRAGRELGVPLTTFDGEVELEKLARAWPEARLLLRIRADAPDARCPLGNKFGAEEWDSLSPDGLYGSLNCILYDHASPVPRLLGGRPGPVAPTTVFGPTCDGLDTLVRDHPLPADAAVGDWLVWHDMGAYTLCGASNFNGMDAVNVPRFYVWSGP